MQFNVANQEKPELPSELDKYKFYWQVAENEIVHPNGTAPQHFRDTWQEEGNGDARRLYAVVVGLHCFVVS